jgi:hypothetical protein
MSSAELSIHAATAGPTQAVNAIVAPAPRVRQNPQVSVRIVQPPTAVVVPPPTPQPPAEIELASRPRSASNRAVATNESKAPVRATGIQLVRIVGQPCENEELAKNDVLKVARLELKKQLEQKFNIAVTPSPARVRDYVLPNSIHVHPADPAIRDDLERQFDKSDWYVAEAAVELSDDQVRQLRQEERVQDGLIGIGGVAVGALLLCGLLRAGTAAGRLTCGRLRPSRFTACQFIFWSIGPPLALFLLYRLR